MGWWDSKWCDCCDHSRAYYSLYYLIKKVSEHVKKDFNLHLFIKGLILFISTIQFQIHDVLMNFLVKCIAIYKYKKIILMAILLKKSNIIFTFKKWLLKFIHKIKKIYECMKNFFHFAILFTELEYIHYERNYYNITDTSSRSFA